jgi:hypothetical protein
VKRLLLRFGLAALVVELVLWVLLIVFGIELLGHG